MNEAVKSIFGSVHVDKALKQPLTSKPTCLAGQDLISPDDSTSTSSHQSSNPLARPNPITATKPLPVSKRTLSHINASPPLSPRSKRPRLDDGTPRILHDLPPFQFGSRPIQPPSPLFFSYSSERERPDLPARFSSSEAAARMLSKTRGEDSGIRTVTLARGSLTESSPSAPSPSPGVISRDASSDTIPKRITSTDSLSNLASPALLTEIGIVELIDQDVRPTFIVDLADPKHLSSPTLRLVYSNPALRALPVLDEIQRGRSNNDVAEGTPGSAVTNPRSPSAPRRFSQFKAWVLGMGSASTSKSTSSSSFMFHDFVWTYSTIRKRLRVVNATAAPKTLHGRKHVSDSAHSEVSPAGGRSAGDQHFAAVVANDYFGDATPQGLDDVSKLHATEATKANQPLKLERTAAPKSPRGNPPWHKAEQYARPPSPMEVMDSSIVHGLSHELLSDAEEDSSATSVTHATLPMDHDLQYPPGELDAAKMEGHFDWTRLPVTHDFPEHIRFARSIRWEDTALGHISTWSPDLRQMCNLIMASPHPAAMYWGSELVAIYNEAYVLLAGRKHPRLMGQRYQDAWSEIWQDVKDVFANAQQTGEATMKDDDCLFTKRNDYLEETYFSWSIIPIVGGDGRVAGLYNPAFEKTRRKIAERRMLTLREVGERTATARDVRGFWNNVSTALESNEWDTPFVLLYSVGDDNDSDSASIHSNSLIGSKQCYLEGSLGVPHDHPAAPMQASLKEDTQGFIPVFREVMKADKPMLLDVTNEAIKVQEIDPNMHTSSDSGGLPHAATGQIPVSMLEGFEFRGFGDRCRSVVVCPVHPTTGEAVLGFVVLGVNPRRPYDDDYHLFVQLLSRQLATSLASVVLFEEEIRRGQKAAKLAAKDRIELSEQLAARTREAREVEMRFTRMAEFSPAGLFIADHKGQIIYANDTWYEITRVHRDSNSTDRWIDAVHDDDRALVQKHWHKLINNVQPVTAEYRFKAPWEDRNGNQSDTWVLFSAYPEKHTVDVVSSEDGRGVISTEGSLKSVFGSVTNISQQKWAEGFQKRKMEEAVELKRQQENFIDITSHEMRNPLSAILQCSDEISSSLTSFKERHGISAVQSSAAESLEEVVDASIDAAQTIALCAQHQKRIVDDILTLSKLDSAMLMVTPVDVRPIEIVQRALKMFEGEVATASIEMRFHVDSSFEMLGIDWVRLDPSRVLQVLINLTTNAIKFTSSEAEGKKRAICVTIAAYKTRPSQLPKGERLVDYFPPKSKQLRTLPSQEWGNGDEVYLNFAVQDTGRGLTESEKKLLFLRFSQASPRTHVQYGGSGLGLFISRELTELQGGEIGVSSEAGEGSTFAFYIKARTSTRPTDAELSARGIFISKDPSQVQAASQNGSASQVQSLTAAVSSAAESNAAPIKRRLTPAETSVLIVEDNLVNQKVLQKQLKKAGFVVSLANHGGECLDALRESGHWHEHAMPATSSAGRTDGVREINVVLMDQEMPVMDGLTCTKKIREWERARMLVRHVPIIAVTANARQEQIETLLAAGMDDVVSKPFRIPELVPKIEDLVATYPADAPASWSSATKKVM